MNAAAAGARHQTVSEIRARVGSHVGTWLTDAECIQIACACAMRQPAEMLEFLFTQNAAQLAMHARGALTITQQEWTSLFGSDAVPSNLDAFRISKLPMTAQLESALRCTVKEHAQSRSWLRLPTKAAAVLAIHMEEHEESMAASLGNIVLADSRRLEDLRSTVDDEGVQVMAIAEVLEALSRSVT